MMKALVIIETWEMIVKIPNQAPVCVCVCVCVCEWTRVFVHVR